MTEIDSSSQEVLAAIEPAPLRRGFGILAQLGLGGLLIYVALAQPPQVLIWQVFLLLLGCAAVFGAIRMERVTSRRIELTREELRDSSGLVLARVDQIDKVERGAFAFKPSNGFLLHLDTSAPLYWAPGLWWRLGRRVAVGGVTSAAATKSVAEILSVLLAQRAADALAEDEVEPES